MLCNDLAGVWEYEQSKLRECEQSKLWECEQSKLRECEQSKMWEVQKSKIKLLDFSLIFCFTGAVKVREALGQPAYFT